MPRFISRSYLFVKTANFNQMIFYKTLPMGLDWKKLNQVRRVLPLFCHASTFPFRILREESCSTVMKPLLSILGSPTATDGRRPPRLATSGQINRGWNLSHHACRIARHKENHVADVAAEWATYAYVVDIKLYWSFDFFRCDFIHSAFQFKHCTLLLEHYAQ